MNGFRLSLITLSLLSITYENIAMASVDISSTQISIQQQVNDWFSNIQENVVTHTPEKDSKIAEWDRQVSHDYQKIEGERKQLAIADKNQDHMYVWDTYIEKIFMPGQINADLKKNQEFNKIELLYRDATRAFDPTQSKIRSIDFILKDQFGRARPYQAMDNDGNYIDHYTEIKGSSFPSGHTFNGFKQAVTLSILFPEKAGEIFDRAIEYGESRVIVGAHFGTDTIASRVLNYYMLSQLLSDDLIAQDLVNLAKDIRKDVFSTCENKACFVERTTPYQEELGYYGKKEQDEAPRISIDQVPEKAGALLRLRFPYLNNSQLQEIIASTAYPSNSLAGWNIKENNPDSYWGLINLPKAYNGPSYLYSTFTVDQNKNNQAYDLGNFTEVDVWKNDISGPGDLIKKGDGHLILSGNNQFASANVQEGNLVLTGENKYSKTSNVDGGMLTIMGQLNSNVDVNQQGTLFLSGGEINSQVNINNHGLLVTNHGTINQLNVNSGGAVSPNDTDIGILKIRDNINFEKDSTYLVNITANGSNDRIESDHTATLNGGNVKISLKGTKNILSEHEVRSLIGSQYKILSAQNGITGQFQATSPNYLFLGTTLTYHNNDTILNVGRNKTSFASITKTQNQANVAQAIDRLNAGNPLLESILFSNSEDQARHAFHELSGQIHSDVISQQINSSRYLRNAWNNRIQFSNFEPIKPSNDQSAWANYLHSQQRVSDDHNASGYKASTHGFFMGFDVPFQTDLSKLGIIGGYTSSSLDGHKSTANSDNIHLGLYAGTQKNNLNLKAGYGYTWHDIDTKRSVDYMEQSDQNNASYKANTNQFFVETGYAIQAKNIEFQPFLNLTYVNFDSKGGTEDGGAASLMVQKQKTDATLSNIGFRIANQLNINEKSQMTIRSSLGWQHHYGELNQDAQLTFNHSNSSFNVSSVPLVRDAAALNISTDVAIKDNLNISLGYDGIISKDYKDNSLIANLTWKF